MAPGDAIARFHLRGRYPNDPALLALANMPAGEYAAWAEGGRLDGTLSVIIGRTGLPSEVWPLEGRLARDTGLRLHLPTRVHSVRITGDAPARQRMTSLSLRPILVGDQRAGEALQAARYGPTRVFAMDDAVFLEPGALWTRGDATTRLWVLPDEGEVVDVTLVAGAVETTLTVEDASGSRRVTLQPGERETLRLSGGAVTLETTGGCQPRRVDTESHDGMWLGVRVEFQ